VSAGPQGPGIAVLGFGGSLIRIIEPKGATGLALADGELYAAAAGSAELDVIDTATLSLRRSIPLGGWTQPGDLQISNGLPWFFGQPPTYAPFALLASVGLDGEQPPHAAAGPVGGTSPRFVEGAGAGQFLYTFDLSAHAEIRRYQVVGSDVGDQLSQDSSNAPGGNYGSAQSVYVPGRDTILMATGRTAPPPYETADAVTEVSTQTLSPVMTYPVAPSPEAVAATAGQGGLLAATTWSRSGSPMIWVFRPGNPTVAWTSSVPGPDQRLIPAWPRDGRSLFLVGGHETGPTSSFGFTVVHPFTESSRSSGSGVSGVSGKRSLPAGVLVVSLCIAAGLGLLVAFGARSKGYGPLWLWWAFGFLAFLIAVIVILVLPRRPKGMPGARAALVWPSPLAETSSMGPPPVPPPPLPVGRPDQERGG
jgi:hypothetical protein